MPLARRLALLHLPRSIRTRLLLWLSIALVALLSVDVWASYRATLRSTQQAYDRLLVTSAHAIADLIRLERGRLVISLPHAALEIYGTSADPDDPIARGRMSYRVGFFRGEYLAGDTELAPVTHRPEVHPLYGSMIDLYDSSEGANPMRVAALLQPVESFDGTRLVMVQVAEPSQYRSVVAKRLLAETLLRQAGLLAVCLAMFWVVSRLALRPLGALGQRLAERPARDLSPVRMADGPSELNPVLEGFNSLLERLRQAQDQQRRFVADASHQLRTPLTVLQVQADAGLKGDIPPLDALNGVAQTTQRAARLAEQLLSLARAQQAASTDAMERFDLKDVAGEVVIELSSLIAGKSLDFHFDCASAFVESHRWMVQEILANLVKNAIEFTPQGGSLGLSLGMPGESVEVVVWDTGCGLSPSMIEHAFKPFATDRPTRGAGLGLAICKDLADAAGASLQLANRTAPATGLEARVRFAPPADPAPR